MCNHHEDVLWPVVTQQLRDCFDCEHLLNGSPVVSHLDDNERGIEKLLRPYRDLDVSHDLRQGYVEVSNSRGVIDPKQRVACLTEGGTLLVGDVLSEAASCRARRFESFGLTDEFVQEIALSCSWATERDQSEWTSCRCCWTLLH